MNTNYPPLFAQLEVLAYTVGFAFQDVIRGYTVVNIAVASAFFAHWDTQIKNTDTLF
jgi:hypothetical protein